MRTKSFPISDYQREVLNERLFSLFEKYPALKLMKFKVQKEHDGYHLSLLAKANQTRMLAQCHGIQFHQSVMELRSKLMSQFAKLKGFSLGQRKKSSVEKLVESLQNPPEESVEGGKYGSTIN